jgi:hypothetical protein
MSTRYMHPQRWVRRLEGWEENSTTCIDIGLVSCLSRVPITATSGSARRTVRHSANFERVHYSR